MAPFNQ